MDLLTSMIGCFNCPNTASHVQSMQSNLDYLTSIIEIFPLSGLAALVPFSTNIYTHIFDSPNSGLSGL